MTRMDRREAQRIRKDRLKRRLHLPAWWRGRQKLRMKPAALMSAAELKAWLFGAKKAVLVFDRDGDPVAINPPPAAPPEQRQ